MLVPRKKCKLCGKLSEKWQSHAGVVTCFDGCYSTTGSDKRTVDGNPAWLPYGTKPAWDPSRMNTGHYK